MFAIWVVCGWVAIYNQLCWQMEEEPLGPFSYNYLKAVHHFETLALEGQDLHFHPHKLTAASLEASEREVTSLAEL